MITVNNIPLETFIAKHEQIKPNENPPDKVYPYRHIKPKYTQLKEKNGRVVKMGEKEKNFLNFDSLLQRFVKARNYKGVVLTVLLCRDSDEYYTSRSMTDYLLNYDVKHGISLNTNIEPAIRSVLGSINKSKFREYLDVIERDFPRIKQTKYRVHPDKKEIAFDEAFELIFIKVEGTTPVRIKRLKQSREVLNNVASEEPKQAAPVVLQKLADKTPIQFIFNGPVTINFTA
jgi:hypothetical protein